MSDIFMFSGQGSQYYQMGRDLYETEAAYRYWFDRLDQWGVDIGGRPLAETLYAPSRSKAALFDRLTLTNPAIFVVEYAIAMTLIGRGVVPDLTLGSSLGLFAAAAVSEALDPFDALALVIRLAELFELHAPAGGMLAVLASPESCAPHLLDGAELVSVTFDGHFILAAPAAALAAIQARLAAAGTTCQKLPVRFPFHSSWIDPLETAVTNALAAVEFRPPRLPIICCAETGAIGKPSARAFWTTTRAPIRLRETVENLESTGPHRYIDAGPSGTLAGLLKYILPADSRSETATVATPFGRDIQNLMKLVVVSTASAD